MAVATSLESGVMDVIESISDLLARWGWGEAEIQAIGSAISRVIELGGNLLVAAVILLIGWGLGRVFGAVAKRGGRALGLDRMTQHLGFQDMLARADVRITASDVLGWIAYWGTLLTAILWAVETLGLRSVSVLIDRWVAFVPSLVGALFVAFLGLVCARPAAGLARSAAVASGLGSPVRVGIVVQWAVVSLGFVVALQQLGVATEILVLPLTAVVGAITLSAGITFALGARPLVTHILAGHFLRRSLPRDSEVFVDGIAGHVERVGSTETRLRGEAGSRSIPNAKLLEAVVSWS